ncbi:MAG TPA: dihydroneopterin aldolase [bacterium]|nr:dihydroneopterin aldolase [bacterium]HPN42057.1 dihydroneopterin aldolase [bacterium]
MKGDKLRILGMTFHAYHGLDDSEQRNGQRFEIDIELSYDSSKAAQSDKLKDTIDVREVYRVVYDIVINKRFYLIESLSQAIADAILAQFAADLVTVRVKKPVAPLGGLANGTEIEITRSRT